MENTFFTGFGQNRTRLGGGGGELVLETFSFGITYIDRVIKRGLQSVGEVEST